MVALDPINNIQYCIQYIMKEFRVSEARVQIYLPREQYHQGKVLAKKQGMSFAKVIREALAEYLKTKSHKTRGLTKDDPLNKLVGFIKTKDRGGATDVSTRHDEYLAEAIESHWKESS